MLKLARREGESILIGDDIEVVALAVDDRQVKPGVAAPNVVSTPNPSESASIYFLRSSLNAMTARTAAKPTTPHSSRAGTGAGANPPLVTRIEPPLKTEPPLGPANAAVADSNRNNARACFMVGTRLVINFGIMA